MPHPTRTRYPRSPPVTGCHYYPDVTVLARGGDPPEPPACAPRPAVVLRRHSASPGGRPPGTPAALRAPLRYFADTPATRRAVGPDSLGRLRASRRRATVVLADSTGRSPGPSARGRQAGNDRLAVTVRGLCGGRPVLARGDDPPEPPAALRARCGTSPTHRPGRWAGNDRLSVTCGSRCMLREVRAGRRAGVRFGHIGA